MKECIEVSIPGRPEYIPTLKVAVSALAEGSGFSSDAIEDINVCMVEACKSIVCHGSLGYCKEFTVSACCDNDEIEIKVFTNSTDRVSKNGRKICMECPKEGDLGEFVMKSLMDSVVIDKDDDGKGCVTMVKKNGRSGL